MTRAWAPSCSSKNWAPERRLWCLVRDFRALSLSLQITLTLGVRIKLTHMHVHTHTCSPRRLSFEGGKEGGLASAISALCGQVEAAVKAGCQVRNRALLLLLLLLFRASKAHRKRVLRKTGHQHWDSSTPCCEVLGSRPAGCASLVKPVVCQETHTLLGSASLEGAREQ